MTLSDDPRRVAVPAGSLTNLDDVRALDAQIDADMDATDAAARGCTALAPSDLTAWSGFLTAWKAEHAKWRSYDDAGWWNVGAKVDELALAGDFADEMRGYAHDLATWKARIHNACPSYQPTPGPPAPVPGPGSAGSTDWATLVKWGVGGLLALVVISQVGLPRLFPRGSR